MVILLKIIIKDIIFEKKKLAILLPEIYFLRNIKNELLNPKKVKGATKEKKNKINLI